jgi:hypothetical protein
MPEGDMIGYPGAKLLLSTGQLAIQSAAGYKSKWTFYKFVKIDESVKSRHSRAGGNPYIYNQSLLSKIGF